MKFGHPFTPYQKLILNCCPIGFIPTKELTPHVPISPAEIIKESLQLAAQGVSILHLHARDRDGQPTWDKNIYREIICGIREHNQDVVICVSTSGRFWEDFERRSEVLELTGDAKPDMASLSLGSMNFMSQASINSPQMIRELLRKMNDHGIRPELEIFDLGMMQMLSILRKEGLLTGCAYLNILLGNLGTAPAELGALSLIIDQADKETVVAVSGLGRSALPVHLTALAAGVHLRFGLEDGIYYDLENKILATNFTLLSRLLNIAQLLNRPIASATETRELLGLNIFK